MKYATVLLEHCAEETTKLFIEYYTGSYKPKQKTLEVSSPSPQNLGTTAIQNLAAFLPRSYSTASNVASPATPTVQKTLPYHPQKAEVHDLEPPDYDVPRPRTSFSSFVDHPDKFIVFLEACLEHDAMDEEDKRDLYTTLFEMYLHAAKEKKGDERDRWSVKAKKLIDDGEVSIGIVALLSQS